MSDHKPSGYNSVSPYLVVNGAANTIEFLKQVFAAGGTTWWISTRIG